MKIALLWFIATALLAAAPSKRTEIAPAITNPPATITTTETIRLTRVEILPDAAGGARIVIFREHVWTLPDGTVFGRSQLPAIVRAANDAAADKVGAIILSDWLDALGLFAAKWAAEDAATPLKLVPPKPPTT